MKETRHIHLLGATGQIRAGSYDNRDHIVVPVVALMEGVIHAINAATPEFVPIASLMTAPQGWNGRPVVLGHPSKDGRQISANDPHILEAKGLGTIFKSRVEGKKLLMEAWIDPVKAERIGGAKMLERLRNGDMCEVSVGAYVTTDETPGDHNGKPYRAVWKDIVPDHLAFLQDGVGACSIEMGCGAHRAAECAEVHLVTAEGFEILGGKGSGRYPKGSGGGGNTKKYGQPTQADYDVEQARHQKQIDSQADWDRVNESYDSPGAGMSDPGKDSFNRGGPAPRDKNFERGSAIPNDPAFGKGGTFNAGLASHEILHPTRTIEDNGKVFHQIPVESKWKYGAGSKRSPALLGKKAKLTPKGWNVEFGSKGDGKMTTFNSPYGHSKEQAEIEFRGAEAVDLKTLSEHLTESHSEITGILDELTTAEENPELYEAQTEAIHALSMAMHSTLNAITGLAAKYEDCTTCKGTGTVDGNPCEACDGKGELKTAAGARHSSMDREIIQGVHDNSVKLGADCGPKLMEQNPAAADLKAACRCEGEGMTKEQKTEIVKALVADKHSGFTAGDEKMLEAASDERLEAFRVAAAAREKEVKDAEIKAAEAAEAAKKTPEPKTLSEEQFMQMAPDTLKTLIARQQAADTAQKAALVADLKAAQSEYSESELAAEPLERLERMARALGIDRKQVVSFEGRGVPREAAAGKPDVYQNPPDPYAPGLEALRAATAKGTIQ